jgi:hypothetical protein
MERFTTVNVTRKTVAPGWKRDARRRALSSSALRLGGEDIRAAMNEFRRQADRQLAR